MSKLPARRSTSKPSQPGVMIRRLHQIYIAIYAKQCAEFGTTPVQSSIMQVLLRWPGIDQIALAGEIGVDRTTVSSVLARLEERELVRRVIDPDNRRTKRTYLTEQGRSMLLAMQASLDAAHDQLIAPLSQSERKRFTAQLSFLVQLNNDLGRTVFRIR
jgi:DNA-binding MarR family transcriptional regulator